MKATAQEGSQLGSVYPHTIHLLVYMKLTNSLKTLCGTCVKMKMKINICKSETEITKRRDKTMIKDYAHLKTIIFDHQQCLLTPALGGEDF